MKTTYRLTAALGAVALLAAACGEEPGEGSEDENSGNSDFVGCMVSDSGGIDDKSFNETSWNGLKQAEDDGIIGKAEFVESSEDSDYAPNVQAQVDKDCGLIVTVGFLLGSATGEAAEANPEENFAIVDSPATDQEGAPVELDNVKPLLFNTQEAAFLAGYASAAYSKTGKVGTWGGVKIPTVTIFMDGFYDGVMHFNEEHDADVQVLGWDKEKQDGQFVGNFENQNQAKQISDNMISQGADVIHPVAGPLAASAATAAQEAGNGVAVVWADSDGFESAPDFKDVILTSVLKNMDTAVKNATQETAEDNFSNEPFVGTLENDGVGLAPFHDFDGEIDEEVKTEIEDLKQQIIDGELTVESDASN